MRVGGSQKIHASLGQVGRGLVVAAAAMGIALMAGTAAQAAETTESFRPVQTTRHALVFNPRGVDADAIVGAEAELRRKRSHAGRFQRAVPLRRVRQAVSRQRQLRIRKPRFVRNGTLHLGLEGAGEPGGGDGGGGCTPDPTALSAVNCPLAFDDTGSGSAASVWGSVDCQSQDRVQTLAGGDLGQTALGAAQSSDAFRRMTAYDGDDFWGERCELGHNDHRTGPTAVYHEGDHKLTFASIRLPSSLPLDTSEWQVVLQMKQAQPAANGGGTPVLALRAYHGRWALMQSNSNEASSDSHELWSAPATSEQWTRFAFDVHFSQDPSHGSIAVYVDLNGDGDAADPGEQSSEFHTYTLKREIAGEGNDGIDPGDSIPSHLRAGIYHSPAIACPRGCSVDIDNVQVVDAG